MEVDADNSQGSSRAAEQGGIAEAEVISIAKFYEHEKDCFAASRLKKLSTASAFAPTTAHTAEPSTREFGPISSSAELFSVLQMTFS